MRNIKFRSWDTKNKKFIKHVPESEYMLDSEDWDHDDIDEEGGIYPDRIFSHYSHYGRILFQQFTGIIVDGKELYEGDIIETKYGEIGEVVFTEQLASFRINVPSKKLNEPLVTLTCKEGETNGQLVFVPVKILGNIFENSNLLK